MTLVGQVDSTDLFGDWNIIIEQYFVDGFVNEDLSGLIDQEAAVWRPDVDAENGEKFPLITFSHGYGLGGDDIYYQDVVLNGVASAGYVIVGHRSGGADGFGEYTHDQIRSLEWAKDSELSQFIDWEAPVGIYGYSMGGGATLSSGANLDAIETYNIVAGVALHPATTEVAAAAAAVCAEMYGEEWCPAMEFGVPVIPFLYATGENDVEVPSDLVIPNFEANPSEGKLFVEMPGVDHLEPMYTNSWVPSAVAMFNCHIKNSDADCAIVYANDCSLANNTQCILGATFNSAISAGLLIASVAALTY